MNVSTVNVRKYVVVKGFFKNEFILSNIIYKSDTCTLHVLRNIPNW